MRFWLMDQWGTHRGAGVPVQMAPGLTIGQALITRGTEAIRESRDKGQVLKGSPDGTQQHDVTIHIAQTGSQGAFSHSRLG